MVQEIGDQHQIVAAAKIGFEGAAGKHHGGYGDRPEHYAVAETALIDTLRHSLHATFDAETEAAWRETYALIALTMQQAAAEGAIERACPR